LPGLQGWVLLAGIFGVSAAVAAIAGYVLGRGKSKSDALSDGVRQVRQEPKSPPGEGV
jgi:hypothetical protein